MHTITIREYTLEGWLGLKEVMNDIAGKRWELYGMYTGKRGSAFVVYETAKNHAEAKKLASRILARMERYKNG